MRTLSYQEPLEFLSDLNESKMKLSSKWSASLRSLSCKPRYAHTPHRHELLLLVGGCWHGVLSSSCTSYQSTSWVIGETYYSKARLLQKMKLFTHSRFQSIRNIQDCYICLMQSCQPRTTQNRNHDGKTKEYIKTKLITTRDNFQCRNVHSSCCFSHIRTYRLFTSRYFVVVIFL